MKTIKPQRLGALCRTFENGDEFFFAVTLLVFFRFDAPDRPLPETAMWKFLADELGKDAVLDMGMPKLRGELLVVGKAFQRGGTPRIACAVRVRLGGIDKTLNIVGDRHWRRGGLVSDPEPFASMPVTYAHAFGGPGYAPNPLGKGFAPVPGPHGEVHPLPNVEHPRHMVRTPGDRPPPAGFGPLDLMWPQRFSKTGTYDARWLKERFPGFARDMDWGIFNAAPDDQQIDGYFRGGEAFGVENMHPDKPLLEGRLPGLAARAFVTQRTEDGGEAFRELSTRLDTVWLFPHAERGVLVFRGLARCAEDDGADIVHLLVGCDDVAAPRPLEHYQQVLGQRLDKDTGHLHGLRDGDLLPPERAMQGVAPEAGDPMHEMVATEGLLRKNMRRRAERERQQALARLTQLGLDPADYPLPPLPEDDPAPDLEQLPAVMAQLREQAEKEKAAAEQRRIEQEQAARRVCEAHGLDYDAIMADTRGGGGGPPRFSAEEEIAKLHALAQQARDLGAPIPQIEAMLADPALPSRLATAERDLREAYRRYAHYFPPAARRQDPEAAGVRHALAEAHARGTSFANYDLTGLDLSRLDLRGADLRHAMLENADLTGADLTGADLTGAVLARADLAGARLAGARLAGANLGAARLHRAALPSADLTGAVLTHADLTGADVTDTQLTGADLSEAVLAGADFSRAVAHDLVVMKSDLSSAKLAGVDFTGATFLEVVATGADFSGAVLAKAAFVAARADGAIFRGAQAGNLRLVQNCAFGGADFRGAALEGANLRGTALAESDFSEARLDGADLSECNLRGARFYRAVAREARFVRADLTNAVMTAANLMCGIFQKARIDGANFTGVNLFRADLARVRGRAASMKDANLTQVRVVTRGSNG